MSKDMVAYGIYPDRTSFEKALDVLAKLRDSLERELDTSPLLIVKFGLRIQLDVCDAGQVANHLYPIPIVPGRAIRYIRTGRRGCGR